MKILTGILLLIAAAYLAAGGVLYFGQRALLYRPPDTIARTPASEGFPEASTIRIKTRDGEQLVAWFAPPKDGKPIVLFFHGNAEVLAWRVERFKKLTQDGTGLLAVSFRGYAGSTGSPSEAGLVADGEAAYAFAVARYTASRIALWGYSLGSGVAVQVAARHPVAKLVLEAPYTSTVDIAAERYPFMPVRGLMLDQFQSIEYIKDVQAPLLILHGAEDRVVPITFGERLFAAANEPKRFVRFPESGHVNLDRFGATEIVRQFVSK
ncbi:MAG TPA: alpha/beta fold hydrolase [Xanthobacteraceae bacterium]|jgi:fermentation-respiration switch protein FrsA (DUF1100 family)|nr:alpha/beta fold hydrolase [Xanthobacteraceae bacterium]